MKKQVKLNFNIRIDQKLREDFQKLAESKNTTPSKMIRAMMQREITKSSLKLVK